MKTRMAQRMNEAYIFIGSNIERETNYPAAVTRLKQLGDLRAVSPVYETVPVGDANAPPFYNGAVLLVTPLAPHELRRALREIEREMGRIRSEDKNAPRPIDLDLVLYGDETLDEPDFKLPDPLLFQRGFMAHILADVNPDYVIPPDGPTLAELACLVRVHPGEMVEVSTLSATVRELLHPRATVQDLKIEPHRRAALLSPTASERQAARRAIADAVRTILIHVGEDPTREGLCKTPERVARAYEELLAGYTMDPIEMINGAVFDADYRDMIVVKDIEYFSLCEHHLLPFFGTAHVAYIPNGKVLGLSKIPRIVDMFARRLQIQERMTQEIADFIHALLEPRGVAVIVTGQHLCSMMRGVKKSQAKMVTQAMLGQFQEPQVREQLNERLRQED